jgi:hypothetical protein
MGNSSNKDIVFVSDESDNLSENSWNNMNINQINFEKKLRFLISTTKLSCHGMFGSMKEAKSISRITRGCVKKYIEDIDVGEYREWIESKMPNKIKVSITDRYSGDVCKQLYSSKILNNLLNIVKSGFFKEMYENNDYDNDDKLSLFKTIIAKPSYGNNITSKKELVDLCLKFAINVGKKEHFINSFQKALRTKEEKLIKNKTDEEIMYFINSCSEEYIEENLISTYKLTDTLTIIMTHDEKIAFVDDFIKNADLSKTNLITTYMDHEVRKKIYENKECSTKEKETKFEYFVAHIYNDLTEEEKIKHNKYTIDLDTHYELYKQYEEEYIKLLTPYFLTLDWTFRSYGYDNFDFLNGFNDKVKDNLKKKIHADAHHKTKDDERYNEITSLNDLVDITLFVENPPYFLKPFDCEYHQKHIDEMMFYVKDFGYDENKLVYKKYKMNISFELTDTEQN